MKQIPKNYDKKLNKNKITRKISTLEKCMFTVCLFSW